MAQKQKETILQFSTEPFKGLLKKCICALTLDEAQKKLLKKDVKRTLKKKLDVGSKWVEVQHKTYVTVQLFLSTIQKEEDIVLL